jgi:hypothetical protein
MKRGPLRGAVAVVLAGLAVGRAARAQSTPPAPAAPLTATLTGAAKTDYDAARDLLAQRDFEGALVRFTQVYEQVHDARLLANIALCEKGLSRCARAITLFDEALSTGAALFSSSQTADIRDMVQACSSRVGRVHLAGAPAGATVEIDGTVADAAAPSADFVVEPGTHSIRVSMAGYRDRVTLIAVAAGIRAEVAATLERAGADRVVPVKAADKAALDRVAPARSVLDRAAPARSVLDRVALDRAAAARSVPVGAVAVRAGPNDTISLDDRVVGVRRWEGRVAAGHHSIVVGAEGMETYRADIQVTENQTRTLDVTLAEPSGAPAWMWATGGGLVVAGIVVAVVSVFRPADPIGPTPASTSTPQNALRRR